MKLNVGIYRGPRLRVVTGIANYRDSLMAAIGAQEPAVTYWDARPSGWQRLDLTAPQPAPIMTPRLADAVVDRLRNHAGARWLYHRMQTQRLRSTFGRAEIGLFHAFNYVPPVPLRAPVLPVIYDLSFLRHPDMHPAQRLRALETLPQVIDAAPLLHTISAFSKAEIMTLFGKTADRIVVAPPAASAIFRPEGAAACAPVLAACDLRADGYLLTVGTLEPRKNLKTLIAAFSALPAAQRGRFPLVIVGGGGWGATDLPAASDRLIRDGSLRFLGYVPDPELRALYESTRLFLYPSIYEGFGMPVVEAMACGAAVAHSAGTSMDEISAPDATRVQALDVDGWRTAIDVAMAGHRGSDTLRQARMTRAGSFSWDTSGRLVAEAYRIIAGCA